jgi:hypothetical protein
LDTGQTSRYITITVQIRRDTGSPSMAGGIVPLAGYGIYVLARVVISLVVAYAATQVFAIKQTNITVRDANGKVLAITHPLISTGGGLSMGLIFAGGAVLLFLFLIQRSGK